MVKELIKNKFLRIGFVGFLVTFILNITIYLFFESEGSSFYPYYVLWLVFVIIGIYKN